MAGDTTQIPTGLQDTPTISAGSYVMVHPDRDLVLEIGLYQLRHRDLSRRKRDVVHQLHCVLYGPDQRILHSLDATGPDAVLAEHLGRILDMAQHSRGAELRGAAVRHTKRVRVRLPSTSQARNTDGKDA